MDFCLRCNSLSCRSPLKERAVVTTCSHIFCLQCAENLGLSRPVGAERRCPACQTVLVNPDDAVATILNPTEDYKTSVLSGLGPNTVMECAGRALLFWTYQTTQEIFYQEFLAKTLTDKYTNLNTLMDKIIHNANTEISTLQARLSDMQRSQESLRKKNQELVDMYRDKCKKFSQMTNLYNLLKSRAMRSQLQNAATSQALNSLDPPHNTPSGLASNILDISGPPPQTSSSYQHQVYPVNPDGVEQLHRHQRSGTGSSKGVKQKADAMAMPPPSRLGGDLRSNLPSATPHHRTRLVGHPRPSTGMSQLPHDSIMFERFQANPGGNDGFLSRNDPFDQDIMSTRPATEKGSSGVMRSFFDSTVV